MTPQSPHQYLTVQLQFMWRWEVAVVGHTLFTSQWTKLYWGDSAINSAVESCSCWSVFLLPYQLQLLVTFSLLPYGPNCTEVTVQLTVLWRVAVVGHTLSTPLWTILYWGDSAINSAVESCSCFFTLKEDTLAHRPLPLGPNHNGQSTWFIWDGQSFDISLPWSILVGLELPSVTIWVTNIIIVLQMPQ